MSDGDQAIRDFEQGSSTTDRLTSGGSVIRRPAKARYAGGATVGPAEDEHVVAAKNRWSRVVLPFADLTSDAWCTFGFRIAWDAQEGAAHTLDFALVGVDFLAPDGSSLDFDHVPGLDRTLLDPHGAWIAGPAYLSAEAQGVRTGLVRLAFLVPAPAIGITVTMRSWRNTRGFTVAGASVRQGEPDAGTPARPRRPLGPAPDWIGHALVPGCGLVLRGQLFARTPGPHAALARIVYRNAGGVVLAPPYPGTIAVPTLGALVDLPAHRQARRFTIELQPPPDAVRAEIGFATWDAEDGREEGQSPVSDVELSEVELLAPPEVSLEDGMRLQSLCGDDLLDGPGFLARLAERLSLPKAEISSWCPTIDESETAPAVLARARALQRGDAPQAQAGLDRTLRLAGGSAWLLPEAPDWAEDPFRSVTWRLEYQSLGWLLTLAEVPGAGSIALGLAVSWSRLNPWGAPADGLALHPAALAARTEVFVRLLARAGKPGGATSLILTGEAVRHGFALAEIVGQNTFGRSIHQLQAAAVLIAVARALPRLPLAAHWLGLAHAALADGLDPLLDEQGRYADPSLHQRLELLTFLRAFATAYADGDFGATFAARAGLALPALAALLDPAGRLPAFGDTPHGGDAAAWIGRLMAGSGRALVAERRDARGRPVAETSPPRVDPSGGTFTARNGTTGRGWGHFACTFAGNGAAPGAAHADCTSFVYVCEGVRWIVEAGGSAQLEAGAARHHLLSAFAHNVAIPEGRAPVAGHARYAGTTALERATAHVIDTSVHGPDMRHSRIFVLLDDLSGLAVLDRFVVRVGPVAFEGMLHLSPGILVALASPRRAMAQSGRARLSLSPIAVHGRMAGLAISNGCSEHPGTMRGFVSQNAGALQPTSVLRYSIVGSGRACGGMILASDVQAERRLADLLADDAMDRLLAGHNSADA